MTISPMMELRGEAARRLGCDLECLDPETGYLHEIRRGESRRLLLGGTSPLNDALASRLAEDKFHTTLLVRRDGLRAPIGVRCLKPGAFPLEEFASHRGKAAAEDFAAECGWPLVVKPNRGSRGRGIRLVENAEAMDEAIREVWADDYLALVQAPVRGMDVRLDLLDGEYLMGYTRRGVVLEGDGRSTVAQLLAASDPRFTGELFWRGLADDPLARGLDAAAVPAAGEVLDLRTPILNLNRLCHAEYLPDPPAGLLDVARRAGDALGLRHCGVDLKVVGLDAPADEAVVIEVNASPSLVHIARLGHREEAVAAEMRVVEAILPVDSGTRERSHAY
jgi:cyanophycin synthetase